jgi:hypothetical protein
MKNTGIEVKLLNENHLLQYARMDINTDEHNDPNDHAIFALSNIPLMLDIIDYYTSRGTVLCIACQGIYTNRPEDRQDRFIARRAFIFMNLLRVIIDERHTFFY